MGDLSQRQSDYVAQAPSSCRGAVERSFLKTASPRQAIKAKCLTCSNWQRDEVTHCTVSTCPLWAYRPYQSAGESDGEAEPEGTEA